MSGLRRLAPELSALLLGLTWGVLSAVHRHATVWGRYRSMLESDATMRATVPGRGLPALPPWDLPAPGTAEWLSYGIRSGVLVIAVALLGVALLRAGQRFAAVVVPAALALLPTPGGGTLAGDLLVSVSDTETPALWPYSEGVLQALVVAAPTVLGLLLTRRTWGARPAPILRATTRQALVRSGSAALAAVVVLLLSADLSRGGADTGAAGILLVVVVATGLLIATPQSLPATVAQVAAGTVVLIAAEFASGMNWGDLGNNDWGGLAFGSLFYLAAVAVGPAAVLLTPSAGRAWRRAFRRGPTLA